MDSILDDFDHPPLPTKRARSEALERRNRVNRARKWAPNMPPGWRAQLRASKARRKKQEAAK